MIDTQVASESTTRSESLRSYTRREREAGTSEMVCLGREAHDNLQRSTGKKLIDAQGQVSVCVARGKQPEQTSPNMTMCLPPRGAGGGNGRPRYNQKLT